MQIFIENRLTSSRGDERPAEGLVPSEMMRCDLDSDRPLNWKPSLKPTESLSGGQGKAEAAPTTKVHRYELTSGTRVVPVVLLSRQGPSLNRFDLHLQGTAKALPDSIQTVTVKPEAQSPPKGRTEQTAGAAKVKGEPGDKQIGRISKVKAEAKPEAESAKPPHRGGASVRVKAEAPSPTKPGAATMPPARGTRLPRRRA